MLRVGNKVKSRCILGDFAVLIALSLGASGAPLKGGEGEWMALSEHTERAALVVRFPGHIRFLTSP